MKNMEILITGMTKKVTTTHVQLETDAETGLVENITLQVL